MNNQLPSSRPETNILWIDDKVHTSHQVLVEALQDAGHSVTPASSYQEAIESLSGRRFDVAIVDLRLQRGSRTGFDLLKLLAQSSPTVNQGTPPRLIACSAHLDQRTYRNELAKLSVPVFVLDKGRLNSPNIESAPDEFVRLVEEALADNAWQAPGEFIEELEERALSDGPFGVSRTAFNEMTDAEQAIIFDDGFARCERRLKELRTRRIQPVDLVWALFCGDERKPVLQGSAGDPEPDDNRIETIASSKDRVPFFVSIGEPFMAEEVVCGGSLSDYPRLDLRVGTSPAPRSVHLDTGAEVHILKKTDLIDGDVPVAGLWKGRTDPMSGRSYRYLMIDSVAGALLPGGEASGERLDVELQRVLAIEQWENCRFSRVCDGGEQCDPASDQIAIECGRREGLVGRHLLGDNSLRVTIRGGDSEVDIERAK